MPRPVDAEAWGVQREYIDAWGRPRSAPDSTVEAVLAAMGATPEGPPPGRTPADTPARCVLPTGRAWGWAAQLYAARSGASWGVGDLADLERLAMWAQGKGAGFVLINPLHAAAPVVPQDPSPYSPSTRRFRNVLYLSVGHVPGASDADIDDTASLGRALNGDRLIDRDESLRLKLEALGRIWDAIRGDERFDAYVTEQGKALEPRRRLARVAGGVPAPGNSGGCAGLDGAPRPHPVPPVAAVAARRPVAPRLVTRRRHARPRRPGRRA